MPTSLPPLTLYQNWRSSASWRARWALLEKGLPFEAVWVDLFAGEHRLPPHLARSPLGAVPALRVGDRYLSESVAIFEWLEEVAPSPALYPRDPWVRARVRQCVELVNSQIHPLQSLRVRLHLSPDEAVQHAWNNHFNTLGLVALERLVQSVDADVGRGRFTVGDSLTAADLFLVPQLEHARRFGVDMAKLPRLVAAEAAALASPHAAAALPSNQPGFTP